MTPRERLHAHIRESVAKSGIGAVLVSAGEVAALFDDFATERAAREAAEAMARRNRDYGHESYNAWVETIRRADAAEAQAARLVEENRALRDQLNREATCRHMFGADGEGSSCYLCGTPHPNSGVSE